MIGGQHLYLIQSRITGAFKVGRSSNPTRRLADLQTGSPYELRIILVLKDQGKRERVVHHQLRGYRSQGRLKGEWFKESGLATLPEDIYEMLDLDMVNTWWEGERGPVEAPGPPTP